MRHANFSFKCRKRDEDREGSKKWREKWPKETKKKELKGVWRVEQVTWEGGGAGSGGGAEKCRIRCDIVNATVN